MKKLILLSALLLTTSLAFADGSGLPPTKPPSSSITPTPVPSTSSALWSALWAWLTARW